MKQKHKTDYRPLSNKEISQLETKDNRAQDWTKILVAAPFTPELIENCRFYGTVHISPLEQGTQKAGNISLPVGLYDSTIDSCTLGQNVALHKIGYLSRYNIGQDSLLFNIDEMSCSPTPRFGQGVTIEIANEKGSRAVQSHTKMLPGDAWLWAKYRDKTTLREAFQNWTESALPAPGQYGTLGKGSQIRSCRRIEDVNFGPHTQVTGADRLTNLTLAGTTEQPVIIGEAVQLTDGIVQKGARVDFGAKGDRFILGEETRLTYGARFINSILGANSTIGCCEVQNALLFPFHEQHHNNSFLIAATLQGQSNIAAGATIGSNHNSRGADGEILAERGFWPGLNVSLKHNCRFAPFTLLAKGSYPAELNITLPFSLVSRDESRGRLTVMPAYWFHYNMYALARNSAKFRKRDKRQSPVQSLEFHYLAPDTLEAMREGRRLLEKWCGKDNLNNPGYDPAELLVDDQQLERGGKTVRILRPARAWRSYGELIEYSLVLNLLEAKSTEDLEGGRLGSWINAGGQLISPEQRDGLEKDAARGILESWEDLHKRYAQWSDQYNKEKLRHSLACWCEMTGKEALTPGDLKEVIRSALNTAAQQLEVTRRSREKDFTDPFRLITFRNDEERNEVMGRLEEDSFIGEQEEALSVLTIACEELLHSVSREG
ncbi:MAG: DUF4954 family protein [Spirochaetales bacterium]|nr:DUF4954 family protein [Spirochaetales bacterium]